MAEHAPEHESADKSLVEKITDKIHGHDSSSSDSDDDKPSSIDALKSKVFRLFGREKPIHHVLGAGKRTLFFLSLIVYFSKMHDLRLLYFFCWLVS